MAKVELYLTCHGTQPEHEFVLTFSAPVDWKQVNAGLKQTRCEMHPEITYCDYE